MAQSQSTLTTYTPGYTVNPSKNITGLLDIDRIKANPLYQCTITGGRTIFGMPSSITGIYDTDSSFTISTSSSYSDTFELPSIANKINEVTGFAANMAGKTQFILKSVRMTEQRWAGSSSPEFRAKINIPIVRKENAPWNMLKYVIQATSPTLDDYASNNQVSSTESSWVIYAPNGYGINYQTSAKDADRPKGTYTIQFGNGSTTWFKMPFAIITSSDATLSNKKYYDGNPTSIILNIGFKFWRQPLLTDIIDWFPLANKI